MIKSVCMGCRIGAGEGGWEELQRGNDMRWALTNDWGFTGA